jgi:hypothetical protein
MFRCIDVKVISVIEILKNEYDTSFNLKTDVLRFEIIDSYFLDKLICYLDDVSEKETITLSFSKYIFFKVMKTHYNLYQAQNEYLSK